VTQCLSVQPPAMGLKPSPWPSPPAARRSDTARSAGASPPTAVVGRAAPAQPLSA
jgi:hypothetical protein